MNARSVPKDPMKDVNASELVMKYCEALSVACFHQAQEDDPMPFEKMMSKKVNSSLMTLLPH